MTTPTQWDDKIIGQGRVAPSTLLAHPENWRVHPDIQEDVLAALIDEIGFVEPVTVNKRTMLIVNGHLRVVLALKRGQQLITVTWVDLTDEGHRKALATLDPVTMLAGRDVAIYQQLINGMVEQESPYGWMIDAIMANEGGLRPPAPTDHVNAASGMLWNPETDTSDGTTAQDVVGYDLGSVWARGGNAESKVWPYLLPLPADPDKAKPGALRANYSRSPAIQMEHVVKTYMRPGDYFLEVCAGWWTFSTTAGLYGFNGAGVDIWDVSLNFGRHQLAQLPDGSGQVQVKYGDARDLPFEDGSFDFVYCNPPFFQLETYDNDDQNQLASTSDVDQWLKWSGDMLAECRRVLRPGALAVTVMADYRDKGRLVPLGSRWIAEGMSRGLQLHDIAIQHLLSQQLRFWRHAWNARRTAKAHEYIIVFKKGETT